MAVEIGGKGLVEVNLTIPQGTSLAFTIIHKDEDGNVIDHSQSEISMAFQSKDGNTTYDLSRYCTGTAAGVSASIPAGYTSELPRGKLVWDIFAAMEGGGTYRLAYGGVSIVDTYALDEAQ